ncbi:hypothetical protein [Paraliomyxa miuraensis]|uniref:hypothetical protein n=1 Tax=Paraliomyxa miuraensis TaxID=376150 RepID=UPI0022530E1C|nr:hypothetical protein [Paraliomyxa miuraensis]MCX4245101.1 hypothetical protein [Paraliomyxa miuraensis]
MGELERHDEVFGRLLFDPDLRRRLRDGDWSDVADVADAFSGIDLDELEQLAVAVRDGLVRGSLGGLGIGPAFPHTIAALGGGAQPVVERFLAATRGRAPDGRGIDGTGRRAGISVLEAFHGWAELELADDPSARCRAQHELASALLRALARTPRPGFVVGWPLVHTGPQGWICALDASSPLAGPHEVPEQPIVYVTRGGRHATGRVSPGLAAVLLGDTDAPPPWVVELLARLGSDVLGAANEALAARGLR